MRTRAEGTLRFPGRSAAILAGGKSSRMGRNKALIEIGGGSILRRTADVIRPLVAELFIVADDPAPYLDLGLPVIPDVHRGCGPAGGIHAALLHAAHPLVLCAACDMPLLETGVLEVLLGTAVPGDDAVVPRIGGRLEPLLAVYGRGALAGLERGLAARRFKVLDALEGLRVRFVEETALAAADPSLLSFVNVNTPDELAAARALAPREPGHASRVTT